MIIITGAAGFIGSALLGHINTNYPEQDVIIIDNFSVPAKLRNYNQKKWISCVERTTTFSFLRENVEKIDFVFHLGARTDTTETDVAIFDRLNLNYSRQLWDVCCKNGIPLIYASSAATYGDGSLGYKDEHKLIRNLEPLNAYGESKNDFDKWVIEQKTQPPFWAGLKFFNVYGPNEYHKGRMASVVFHAFNQIRLGKKLELFKSHHPGFKDGKQERDFIYVKDVLKVCSYLYENHSNLESGIYNVGTGEARSFLDLGMAVFKAMGISHHIEFIEMPDDLREKYQYHTCAIIDKIRKIGYTSTFTSLEQGIQDYVENYLYEKKYL